MMVIRSAAPPTPAAALRWLRSLPRSGPPVELRIDGMTAPPLARLLAGPRPPVIVTCRSRREGGRFAGSRARAAGLLAAAADAGAEFIDVEMSLGPSLIGPLMRRVGRDKIILSHHHPRSTPDGLAARFREMARRRPAIVKIAAYAQGTRDAGRILGILRAARQARRPVCGIAMGGYGSWTRILQGTLGGAMTFASDDGHPETAPGQVSYSDMTRLYRTHALGARTRIFGLLGNPVSHSRGIRFHNAVFARRRRDAVYVNFLVDDLDAFLDAAGGFLTGLSVTMPFKREILPRLDRLEESAAVTGAVNTVLRRRGRLTGWNTDFLAFLPILRRGIRPGGGRMLVVGSGATAASAAAAGALAGASVTITARSGRSARDLAGRFGGSWLPWSDRHRERFDILVNATPLGLGGELPPVAARALRARALVIDCPAPAGGSTPLVRAAARAGCRVIDGAAFFRAQARLQSRLFLELA